MERLTAPSNALAMVVAGLACTVSLLICVVLGLLGAGWWWAGMLEFVSVYVVLTVVCSAALAPRWVPEYRRSSGCEIETALAGLGHFLAAQVLALALCFHAALAIPAIQPQYVGSFADLVRATSVATLLAPLVTGQLVTIPFFAVAQALVLRNTIPESARPSGTAWDLHRARLAERGEEDPGNSDRPRGGGNR